MIPAKQEMEVKMAEKLRITLVKSPIGAVPKHRKTVEAMGLTKMLRQLNFQIMLLQEDRFSRLVIC